VREKCNREVEKVVLAFNAQQEAVHALLELASFAEDLLRVALTGLGQFIRSNQQLLRVCDRILTHRKTATLMLF